MEKIVTPETMQRVDIKQGWLLDQFAGLVLGLDVDDQDVAGQYWLSEMNVDLAAALVKYDALVYQKNQQYKDAWQKDGPITALVDLKDKLYRLESASESGAVLTWDKDKLRGTLFDILIRTIMCLSWQGLNFTDDDDDREKQE